jgi:MFS family permease
MSGGYRDALRQPRVIVLGLLRFLPTCYWGMVMTLMPLLIKRSADNNTAVGLYSTVSLIAAAMTQLLVGRAADRWGRRIPTLVMLAGVVTAALGLALSAPRLWGLYGFGILGACSAWSLSTLMPSLVADAIPPIERSRALGVIHLSWNAGMILGSLLGGALVDMAACLPFFIVALLNGGAWALAYHFFGTYQKRET